MNIPAKNISIIIDIATRGDVSRKGTFHRLGKEYLREVARLMLLREGTYDIRVNKGGPAVLGEVILHSDTLYVCLGGSIPSDKFYYRTCQGRRDFTGGANNWMLYTALREPFRAVMAFERARP